MELSEQFAKAESSIGKPIVVGDSKQPPFPHSPHAHGEFVIQLCEIARQITLTMDIVFT